MEYLSIGGMPKSGTTLLMALLDGHREILMFPEELYWWQSLNMLPSVTRKNSILKHPGINAVYKGSEKRPRSGNREYNIENFGKLFDYIDVNLKSSKSKKEDLLSIFHAYKKCMGVENKVKYCAEKTPLNELYIKEINKMFLNNKFIQIVRNPVYNFLSYRKHTTKVNPKKFAALWIKSQEIILQNKPQNSLILRYEDLTKYSNNSIDKIVKFLGIDKTQSLFVPTRGNNLWSGNSVWGVRVPSKIREHYIPEIQQEDYCDLKLIEEVCYNHMIRLGYKPKFATKKKNVFISKNLQPFFHKKSLILKYV